MFKSGAAAEKIVGDIEYVIGLVVGCFQLQDLYRVEGSDESALMGDLMDECDTAVDDGVCFFGHFESDGGVGELRSTEGCKGAVGALCDFLLALVESFVSIFSHLKSFPC